MSDEIEIVDPKPPKAKKEPKPKKRMSDFEILRTIFQRTSERKMVNLLHNMGMPSDVHLLCSVGEEGFLYGSASLSIAMVQFTDPQLKLIADTFLDRLLGYSSTNPMVINLRDQISEFGKTKGESFDAVVETNADGAAWCVKVNKLGNESVVKYATAVDSLFHFHAVENWRDTYIPFLDTTSPDHLYFPYKCELNKTHEIVRFPYDSEDNHPIKKLYPDGFRIMTTKGIGALMTKSFEKVPYPIISEEMIVFLKDGSTAQMIHRVRGEGWRMIIVRPNAHLFPSSRMSLIDTGYKDL